MSRKTTLPGGLELWLLNSRKTALTPDTQDICCAVDAPNSDSFTPGAICSFPKAKHQGMRHPYTPPSMFSSETCSKGHTYAFREDIEGRPANDDDCVFCIVEDRLGKWKPKLTEGWAKLPPEHRP